MVFCAKVSEMVFIHRKHRLVYFLFRSVGAIATLKISEFAGYRIVVFPVKQ